MKDLLLTRLQQGLPLEVRPFQILAREMNSTEGEVLEWVHQLKAERMIRRLSPIYDTRMLGYDSSLVAFVATPERLEETAQRVSEHPGVSHNYERSHGFNLWFTLALPPDSRLGIQATVELVAGLSGVTQHAILRSRRVFKIGVKLKVGVQDQGREPHFETTRLARPLDAREQAIVRFTQGDLELVPRPFLSCSGELCLNEEELVEHLRDLQARGVMRRFAAVLHHRRAGFRANGMAVWQVPPDRLDEVGGLMASYNAISHCYERTTAESWPYNVFSMIHGHSKQEVEAVAGEIRSQTGLAPPLILYSVREFKKKPILYFSTAIHDWEGSVLALPGSAAALL
ncbi:MAG: Lrp/AsnC family transcriptional regulator [Armatimonadetes bacterium]|nr:Lrp/AsnC family transcriptional regulator [Armatimonadota bacterium]